LKRILLPNGYISNGIYYFYLRDHLGNNAVSTQGQTNYYFPYGKVNYNESYWGQALQPYKFGGKEEEPMFGLNLLDFVARQYDPLYGRFLTVDPHAESYYSWSPYAYAGCNPLRITDPTGMDWFMDGDSTYQFSPEVHSQDHLQKGQTYIGSTYTRKDNNGNIENYRGDGSIMFTNESSAYSRMVSNTQKTGNEEMGAILNNGVLVLPSYLNDKGESKYSEYGYSFNNGNLVDGVSGKELNTVALTHTHPGGSGPSGFNGDGSFMAANMPNKPNYVFMMNEGKTSISFIISNGTRPYSDKKGGFTGYMSFHAPFMTYKNVTSGNPQYSLRVLTKQNINAMKKLIP
jgi:RHS repeat-associated protein